MTHHIKNMVCNRCISAVEGLFESLGYAHFQTGMGWVALQEETLDEKAKAQIAGGLKKLGFELIDDRKSRIIEGIRSLVIQKIQHGDLSHQAFNWSDLIADGLNLEYKYLSTLFSSVEGITIEQFTIFQKIEKAKELIVYDELSMKEIAFRLGYSSVAHLSNQFKKVTGMPPGQFREAGMSRRKALDQV